MPDIVTPGKQYFGGISSYVYIRVLVYVWGMKHKKYINTYISQDTNFKIYIITVSFIFKDWERVVFNLSLNSNLETSRKPSQTFINLYLSFTKDKRLKIFLGHTHINVHTYVS